MTHTTDKEPSIDAIISDMREAWARTTAGEWGKGKTTHETVARGGREKEYKIAEFRHADDAAFCDLAHAFVPRLLDELEASRKVQPAPEGYRLQPLSEYDAMCAAIAAAPQPPESNSPEFDGIKTEAAPVQLPFPDMHYNGRALYAEETVRQLLAAQARKPLSDEEIRQIYAEEGNWDMVGPYVVTFTRAIERAHGIKE